LGGIGNQLQYSLMSRLPVTRIQSMHLRTWSG